MADSKDKSELSEKSNSKESGVYSCLDGWRRCCPVRYIVLGLACVGMITVNAMRTNVGFTVITILDETSHLKVGTAEASANLPRVRWNTRMIGFLHSIFYIGYLITHIPGGYLATKLPSYRLYGGSILLSSALNLLLPTAIKDVSYTFTCIVRFLQGLSEGLLYPACYGILRHWSTPQERGRTGSTVLTGAYFGAVLGFPAAGLITHFIGWQYIFYLNGGIGIVWVLLWLCFASEKPSHHKLISDNELGHLQKSQGDGVLDYENGIYSSIPHIAKVIAAIVSGCIADWLLLSKTLDTTNVRKLLTGLAFGVEATGFFALSFLDSKLPVLIVLTIAVGASGFAVSGWQINHYDLSTRHASFLVGLSSTVGNIASVAAPLVAGHLTQNQDKEGWRAVFYFTAGVALLAFILFLSFGSGEQQEWSCPPEHINLIQKTDPLARRLYKSHSVQSPSRDDDLLPACETSAPKKPARAYSLQSMPISGIIDLDDDKKGDVIDSTDVDKDPKDSDFVASAGDGGGDDALRTQDNGDDGHRTHETDVSPVSDNESSSLNKKVV
ncbi:vesicular glutamate transporter 2-like isoform X3 [Gigantopelta aegis]|uniref:vesicular glutamate transporter 2-like isoform X3 n=1 Tax=Gigantopelta aegis TaxID=1735272 RepID=UPI001B8884FC|nr:vesicular glutamate transporter 2-like isoform X3 [Gigantopelta aegis]